MAKRKKYGVDIKAPKGKYWMFLVNLDGTISEAHTFKEAKEADFHPHFYFSRQALSSVDERDSMFVWLDRGKLFSEYFKGNGRLPKDFHKEVLKNIRRFK